MSDSVRFDLVGHVPSVEPQPHFEYKGLVYSCSGCGAVVFDRDTHHAWHERIGDAANE